MVAALSACGEGPNQDVTTTSSSLTLSTSSTYAIVGAQSGKCVEIPGGVTTLGVQAAIATCNGATRQLWRPEAVGGGVSPAERRNESVCRYRRSFRDQRRATDSMDVRHAAEPGLHDARCLHRNRARAVRQQRQGVGRAFGADGGRVGNRPVELERRLQPAIQVQRDGQPGSGVRVWRGCASGNCVDGVCCSSATCGDLPGLQRRRAPGRLRAGFGGHPLRHRGCVQRLRCLRVIRSTWAGVRFRRGLHQRRLRRRRSAAPAPRAAPATPAASPGTWARARLFRRAPPAAPPSATAPASASTDQSRAGAGWTFERGGRLTMESRSSRNRLRHQAGRPRPRLEKRSNDAHRSSQFPFRKTGRWTHRDSSLRNRAAEASV